MNRIKHLGIASALGLASLAISFMSPAQVAGAGNTLCYGLSTKDCQVLTAAEANVSNEKSFQGDFDFTGSVGNTTSNVNVTGKGSAVFSYDPSLANDQAAAFQAAKLKLDISTTLTSKGMTPAINQKASSSVIVLDGILYNNASPLGWVGYSIQQQIDAAGNAFTQGFEQMAGSSIDQAFQDFLQDPSIAETVAALPTIKGFVTLRKTTNVPVVEGQKQVEFVYSFDLSTLIKAKEVRPFLKAFISFVGTVDGLPLNNLSDIQLANVATVFSRVFSGTTITLTRWVGSKDNFFHAVIIDIALNFNPAVVNLATSTIRAGTLKAHFSVKLSKVNQALPSITPPPDALLDITPSATPTLIPSDTPTLTDTPVPSDTSHPTYTPTNTRTPTHPPTLTHIPTSTTAPTNSPTATGTSTHTSTPVPTSAATDVL